MPEFGFDEGNSVAEWREAAARDVQGIRIAIGADDLHARIVDEQALGVSSRTNRSVDDRAGAAIAKYRKDLRQQHALVFVGLRIVQQESCHCHIRTVSTTALRNASNWSSSI